MSTLTVSNITGLTDLVIDGVDIDATAIAAFDQANLAFDAANNAGGGSFVSESFTQSTNYVIDLTSSSNSHYVLGDTIGNTTITFTNIPKDRKWSVEYTANGAVLSFSPETSFSISSFNAPAAMTDIYFKSDGTRMYINLSVADVMLQYDLSTPWLVSSASNTGIVLDLNSIDVNGGIGLFFKPDGTKMYTSGSGTDEVLQFDLSESWNIGTATYVGNTSTFVSSGGTAGPLGLFFKSDGTKFFATSGLDDVREFSLSTAWQVNTETFVANTNITTVGSPYGIHFNTDGTSFWYKESNVSNLRRYDLSESWNVQTATLGDNDITYPNAQPSYVCRFGGDNNEFFYTTFGTGSTTILQNESFLAYTITFANTITDLTSYTLSNDTTYYYEFFTTDSGNNIIELFTDGWT